MQALSLAKPKPSLAIVGCGTVGTAMAKLLGRAGYRIAGVVTSRIDTAARAAQATGADHYSDCPWDLTLGADVVFITTPDDLIASTCSRISKHKGFGENVVVLHCSGALSSEILGPAKNCGAVVATLHPLQSFASVEQALTLVPGSFFAVEGEEDALSVVRLMISDLRGIPLQISADKKSLYHAAAVAASNYFVTLIGFAVELNKAAGLPVDRICEALLPLVRGTLSNINAQGIPGALTGPIARGDAATVSAHLEAVARHAPEFLSLYKLLGRHTVELAKAKKSISQETVKVLTKLLDP